MAPAIVQEGREDEAFEMREAPRMDAVVFERALEKNSVSDFDEPKKEDERAEVLEALEVAGFGSDREILIHELF